MNLRQTMLAMIAALTFTGGADLCNATSTTLPFEFGSGHRTVVLRTSDLRSAYLVRSGQVHYDAAKATPAGLRKQLQRHFDTVVALLMLSTEQSIELALDRLEAGQPTSWSVAERAAWRERLLANRRAQIARLIEYRRRGLFPLNEGHAAKPVPIFVDSHDTACAVGHLMRLSGREPEVAGIQPDNNLVYVPDVVAGPVVAWVLTSGLTLEEAALVQPAYGPRLAPIPPEAVEVFNAAQAFNFDSLRFSNFQTFPAEDGAGPPDVNIPTTHYFCDWFNCSQVVLFTPPAEQFPVPGSLSTESEYSRVVVQFDVEVTAPNLRIANVPSAGTLMSNTLSLGNQLELFASGTRDRLWIDYSSWSRPDVVFPIEGTPLQIERSPLEISDQFPPTDRMTVVTEMLFRAGQQHQAQYINFNLVTVPEPAAALLATLSIALAASIRPRRNRR